MKLLIVTQAVDKSDPVLGFFHRWIEELAARAESVEVICLREGERALPKNVQVHSLGKEHGAKRRAAYAFCFLSLVIKLRAQYDTVFVHMNPEYLVLAGPLWQAWGKKVAFWYNHPAQNFRLRLGSLFADVTFYTSPYAASARLRRAVRMPAGIDTAIFAPQNVPRVRTALYMQGRIMPSKRIQLALDAFRLVHAHVPNVTFALAGPEDASYVAVLQREYSDLISSGAIIFMGPKKNDQTPALYSAHGISLNFAAAGHFDKTVLEAMSCQTPVIVTSEAFAGLIPATWIVRDTPEAVAHGIEKLIALSADAYQSLSAELREAVVREQSLTLLMQKIPQVLAMTPKRDSALIGRYVISGLIATAINLGITALLAASTSFPDLSIVTIAFLSATFVSFLLQKTFTFHGTHTVRTHTQVLLFYMAAAVNLVVNDVVVYALVHFIGISLLVLDQAIASVLVAAYSFFLYRHGIFSHGSSQY
jgi:glycosyltransferase involved in cell wall biosynthesis/putative flippase GtrA